MRIAALLAALLVLAGCGGGGDDAAVSTGAADTTPRPPATTGEVETPTETEAEGSPEISCEPEAFLPVLKRRLDDESIELVVVEARVERCRAGFAQVFAVPDPEPCEAGGSCYETEQVFLRWREGRWRVITFGTGIACGSGVETDEALLRACRGLGYPDLDTQAFRLPSGNIACLLADRVLRCDVFSGLRPEPELSCEFDWVGIELPRRGPPRPNCGSDSVYDEAAPVLAYDAIWRRGGFACQSQEAGLACASRDGYRFTLAREGWTLS